MHKILVVDNDRDMCGVISDIMKEEGCIVSVAYDGRRALERIKRSRHDLLIVDLKLPGMGGIKVLEEARLIRPGLRAVMISAYGNSSVRSRARDLGAYAFLDKPFDVNKLVRIANKALGAKPRQMNLFGVGLNHKERR
ncbi:MAG: response regulator [Deltaproteobacteria bacterium]|nr:response regulator [Deltaproteobacteria bacterium]